MVAALAASLAVWGNGRVQAVIDQGAPVEFVYPKEGAVALMIAAPAYCQTFVR